MIRKTTSIIAKVLAEIDLEMGELTTTFLQNRVPTDYLLLKYYLGCQQLPGVCFLNMSVFSTYEG